MTTANVSSFALIPIVMLAGLTVTLLLVTPGIKTARLAITMIMALVDSLALTLIAVPATKLVTPVFAIPWLARVGTLMRRVLVRLAVMFLLIVIPVKVVPLALLVKLVILMIMASVLLVTLTLPAVKLVQIPVHA